MFMGWKELAQSQYRSINLMAQRFYLMMSNGQGAAAAGATTLVPVGSQQSVSRDYPVQIADLAGTTAQRPVGGDPDYPGGVPGSVDYYDTTLTYVVVSDGLGKWRNPATGGAV
jgi:hypothetical protein